MSIYHGLITVKINGKDVILDIELDIDPSKLQKHLHSTFNRTYKMAAKNGSSQATRLGGALVMKANRVNVIEE